MNTTSIVAQLVYFLRYYVSGGLRGRRTFTTDIVNAGCFWGRWERFDRLAALRLANWMEDLCITHVCLVRASNMQTLTRHIVTSRDGRRSAVLAGLDWFKACNPFSSHRNSFLQNILKQYCKRVIAQKYQRSALSWIWKDEVPRRMNVLLKRVKKY